MNRPRRKRWHEMVSEEALSAPEDHEYSLPTPLADKVRLIASHLIEDCRLAVAYEEMLLDVACKIEALERSAGAGHCFPVRGSVQSTP